jgi:molybdenum cofactor cytidylyltransferase
MSPPSQDTRRAGGLDIAALLLAAGQSRRMGGVNKLLVEVGGEAMVRRMARLLLESGLTVTAVTGHERARVEEALAGLGVALVHNPGYRAGRQSSVLTGLAALGADHDAVLVALGDQPALDREDIAALIAAFAASGRDKFMIPFHNGKRGNPVVIPRAILEEIAVLPGDAPPGPLTDRFPGRIARFDAASDHFVRDIDTPEALEEFKRGG